MNIEALSSSCFCCAVLFLRWHFVHYKYAFFERSAAEITGAFLIAFLYAMFRLPQMPPKELGEVLGKAMTCEPVRIVKGEHLPWALFTLLQLKRPVKIEASRQLRVYEIKHLYVDVYRTLTRQRVDYKRICLWLTSICLLLGGLSFTDISENGNTTNVA